ncbi:MAG: diheme cytochrome c-553, partial [Bacteroidetes bacterium]|nr:diheme cytochrome c-553 [Bacteroidota bacterium]
LIGLMDCHACHTPKTMTEKGPAPDMSRMLSGYPADQPLPELVPSGNWVLFHPELTAAVGPWGITFAANLTPHESGLGNWSLDQFKYALQNGKHMGMENGRPILPPMPWEQYKIATDEDLEAMYAYLQSIPAVDNVVPAPVPPTEL